MSGCFWTALTPTRTRPFRSCGVVGSGGGGRCGASFGGLGDGVRGDADLGCGGLGDGGEAERSAGEGVGELAAVRYSLTIWWMRLVQEPQFGLNPQAALTALAVVQPSAMQPRTSSSVTALQMQTYMRAGDLPCGSSWADAPTCTGKGALNKVRLP